MKLSAWAGEAEKLVSEILVLVFGFKVRNALYSQTCQPRVGEPLEQYGLNIDTFRDNIMSEHPW